MTHEITRFELAQGGWPNDFFPFKWPASERVKTRFFAPNCGPCHTVRGKVNCLFRTGKSVNPYPFWQYPAKTGRLFSYSPRKMKKNFHPGFVAFYQFFSLFRMAEKKTGSVLDAILFLPELAYSLTPYFITLQNVAL
jgi:hypothetical protein